MAFGRLALFIEPRGVEEFVIRDIEGCSEMDREEGGRRAGAPSSEGLLGVSTGGVSTGGVSGVSTISGTSGFEVEEESAGSKAKSIDCVSDVPFAVVSDGEAMM